MKLKYTLNTLTKEELKTLLSNLSIEELREPLFKYKKLDKYTKGFRIQNAGYLQLNAMYYQEISAGNKEIESSLNSAVYSYFSSLGIIELLEGIESSIEWTDCVSLGIALGKAGCEIPFVLLLKICVLEISNDKVALISLLQDSENRSRTEKEKIIQDTDTKINELKSRCDLLTKKVTELNQSNQKTKDQFSAERNKTSELESQLSKMKVTNRELAVEKTKLEVKIENIENQNSSLLSNQEAMKKSISLIEDEKKELVKKLRKIENEKQLQYDRAIERLVKDTIQDLKDEYSIDIKEFDNIVDSIEGEHNILNIWNKISDLNAQVIEGIESSLRNNITQPEIIDSCNDVENNIMAKYVIIKAIKSLYYDYLSSAEKNKKLFDGLK